MTVHDSMSQHDHHCACRQPVSVLLCSPRGYLDVWSLTKVLVKKKKETSQWAMERRTLNVKLKDRIRNTIIRQRTRVADIVQYVTNTKWKWAGHIARMKDNRWTIRSTEWQTEGVRSARRPNRCWRDDIVGQQGAVWTRTAKDRESWRTVAEGCFLQWKDTA